MKKTACAFALSCIVSTLSLSTYANNVVISTCKTAAKCSDNNLKAQSISDAKGQESEVLVYDQTVSKTYRYSVIDVGGSEFPGMLVMASRKVGELSTSDSEAVGDYVEFYESYLTKILDEHYGRIGRHGAYDAYSIANFDANATAETLYISLPNLAHNMSTQMSNLYRADVSSLTSILKGSISATFGTQFFSVSGQVDHDPNDSVKVYLKGTSDGTHWGLVTTFKKISSGVEVVVERVVITNANGSILFEIPIVNNRLDIGSLIGQSFYTSNPGSLRSWFQGINLDLKWYSGCSNCKVTITDLDDPDVGEVEPE